MSNESVLLPTPKTSIKDTTTINAKVETLIKKDLDAIPPCFFVGPHETEKTVTFEPDLNQESGSVVGYGDRRLSGILAEVIYLKLNIIYRRTILDVSDANRGIFGDKRVKVVNHNVDSNIDNVAASHIESLEPSRTIKVFGFPSNLLHNVIEHFMTYGKIEEYYESPGNWVYITYESSTSALSALKSNGIIISKSYMIGVSMDEKSPTVTQNVIHLESDESVFKNIHGLGNGKVGLSVTDKNNTSHASNEIISNGGIISKLKDTLFGW